MQEELLKDISSKMDIIINLLIKNAVSGKNIIETTIFLNDIGLSIKDIASFLNVQQNVITARLSNAKRQ